MHIDRIIKILAQVFFRFYFLHIQEVHDFQNAMGHPPTTCNSNFNGR